MVIIIGCVGASATEIKVACIPAPFKVSHFGITGAEHLPPLHESPGSDDERGTTTTAAGTGAGAGPGAGASAGAPTYGKTKCKWEIVSTDIRMLTPPTSKVPRRLLISTGRNDFDVLFASPEQASSFNSHVMKLIDTKKSKMHRLLSERFKGEMMHVRKFAFVLIR